MVRNRGSTVELCYDIVWSYETVAVLIERPKEWRPLVNINEKEDISDVISSISPDRNPRSRSLIGQESVNNTIYQWPGRLAGGGW